MKKYIKPRKFLTITLSFLASKAIIRHKIRVCVVVGVSGSDIVKEMLYTVLKEKVNIRRNVEDIWWDLSVPLNILGYEDKQRSFLEWIRLVFSAFGAIIKNKPNPHMLVLNIDTKDKQIAKYWSDFLTPKYLVVLNYQQNDIFTNNLLVNISNTGGKVIVQENLLDRFNEVCDTKHLFTYGSGKSDLLLKKLSDGRLKIDYRRKEIILPKKLWPSVSIRISGAIFSVALLEGFDLSSIAYACLKYTFPKGVLHKIKKNLLGFPVNV